MVMSENKGTNQDVDEKPVLQISYKGQSFQLSITESALLGVKAVFGAFIGTYLGYNFIECYD